MSFLNVSSEDRINGTPENFTVKLTNITNNNERNKSQLLGVNLVSFSNTIYQITNKNNSLTWIFSNSTSRIITIPEGSPSSAFIVAFLLANVNVNSVGDVYTIAVSNSTAKITFAESSNRNFSFIFNNNTKDVFGFDNNAQPTASSFTSQKVINVTPNTSLFIRSSQKFDISDINSSQLNSNYMFKVPISGAFGSIVNYQVNNTLMRKIQQLRDTMDISLHLEDGTLANLNGGFFHIQFIYT